MRRLAGENGGRLWRWYHGHKWIRRRTSVRQLACENGRSDRQKVLFVRKQSRQRSCEKSHRRTRVRGLVVETCSGGEHEAVRDHWDRSLSSEDAAASSA